MPLWGIILLVFGGLVCCGLCAYGISTAIRRSRVRRELDEHVLKS